MKSQSLLLAVTLITLSGTPRLWSQGYLVPNGVVTNLYPGEISVVHDPTNYFYTGFAFGPQSTDTFQFISIVDVGVRVFIVEPNDPVTAQAILLGSYSELSFPNVYFFAENAPFYVGLYTGNQNFYPPDGIYNDPLFGWAQLVNNQGVIELLDSALVYKAGGIYTGTQTIIPVPEPDVSPLLIVGAGFFLMRRLAAIRGVRGAKY